MASVDDRVVAMSFENSKFESGVSQSMSTLDKLKNSLKFSGATAGLDQIEKRASRMDLSGISNSLNSIQTKFSGLGLAATAAFATIASQATQAGMRVIKAFTFEPVMAGFRNYETQIQAVQTIMANTGLVGAKGMGQINSALSELNTYANQTIYNFSEMARNIGTFTAAGVDLKTATMSIKGIANLAAASGSTSQQASTAMYQLSQAIAAGKVSLQDWNSVVNAGMGGTMLQKALANTAQAMGTLGKGSVKLVGPMKQLTINGETFRNAIQAKPGQKSWLTSDVLTTALKEFTGDMSKAQLAAIGFNDEQIKAIQTQAKTAVNAATQIKTATQMFQALKEEVATAWSAVFKTIFGGIGGATKLFTSLHTTIQNALTNPIIHFNKVLGEWSKLGGKKDFFAGIKTAAQSVREVLHFITLAFRQLFPAATGKSLAEASKHFRNLMETLRPAITTLANIRRTFVGVFSLFDIGKQVISGIVHFFGMLFGDIRKGSGGLTRFTANVGDVIYAFDQWLKKGHVITDFFEKLAQFIQPVTHWLGQFASNMGHATSAVSGSGVVATAAGAWEILVRAVQRVAQFLKPAVESIVDVFRKTGELILGAIKGQNFDKIFAILETTLVGGLLLAIKNAIGGGFKVDIGQDAIKRVTGSLDILRSSLMTMQQNIKANIILKIAIAIGILAAAVVALSHIPAKKLQSSMAAMAIGLGQLLGAMAVLGRVRGAFFKSAPLIALAVAVDILVIAVKALSKLSWAQLSKGLAGVTGALLSISLATIPLQAAGPRMALAAASLIPLALALVVISQAVRLFGNMNLETIGKGILGIGASLVVIGAAIRFIPPRTLVMGAGLVVLGAGLMSLAGAIKIFASMSLETIGRGILSIAGAIVVIGTAMRFMPLSLPITAAGLILVGIGLDSVAAALSLMGHMAPMTIVKGIGAIAATLAVLAIGLRAMMTALPGAAALLVVSAALVMFVPALGLLGSMSWDHILKGLAAMALTLILFGGLGRLVAPGLVALAVGLGALGIAMLAIGGAVYLLASGVALLANKGVKGVAAFLVALTAMVGMLPSIIINFMKGMVQVIEMIAKLAPKVVAALVVIVGQLLDGLVKLAPRFAVAATALITAFLKVLAENAGPIIAAGFQLLMQFLQGISNNIGRIVGVVAQIVIRFFAALGTHIGGIVAAGADFLVQFLGGITRNLWKIMKAGAGVIGQFLIGLGTNLGQIAVKAGDAVVKFIEGLGTAGWRIVKGAVKLVGDFMYHVGQEIPKVADKGAKAVIAFLNGTAKAIRDNSRELWKAGFNLMWSILQGLIEGIKLLADKIYNLIPGPLRDAISVAKDILGIGSPSTVFLYFGKMITAGFVKGMEDNHAQVVGSTQNMVDHVKKVGESSSQVAASVNRSTNTIGDAIQTALGHIQANKDVEWRITPVVDMTNVTAAGKSISGSFPKVRANVDVPTVQSKEDALLAHSPTGLGTFKFEQNNYSPTALSEREIYRQTRNQLSQAKAALKM